MCRKVVTVIVLVMCWAKLAHPAAHGQPGHKVTYRVRGEGGLSKSLRPPLLFCE